MFKWATLIEKNAAVLGRSAAQRKVLPFLFFISCAFVQTIIKYYSYILCILYV